MKLCDWESRRSDVEPVGLCGLSRFRAGWETDMATQPSARDRAESLRKLLPEHLVQWQTLEMRQRQADRPIPPHGTLVSGEQCRNMMSQYDVMDVRLSGPGTESEFQVDALFRTFGV